MSAKKSQKELVLTKSGGKFKTDDVLVDITDDPRSITLLRQLKTLKNTKKKKLNDSLFIVYNNFVVSMAQSVVETKTLRALYYHDDKKEIIFVKHDTPLQLRLPQDVCQSIASGEEPQK